MEMNPSRVSGHGPAWKGTGFADQDMAGPTVMGMSRGLPLVRWIRLQGKGQGAECRRP